MTWKTDKEPIEYLRQRVKYYQKKMGRAKNSINDPVLIHKYGDELPYIVTRRILSIQSWMDMFKKAVKDLEIIENAENLID